MSKILDDVLETAKDLHDSGHMSDEAYDEIFNLCRLKKSINELDAGEGVERELIESE